MKSYKDLFSDNGIITALKSVNETKYNEIFGSDYDNELLDDFILFSNSNYICTTEVENLFEDDSKNALNKLSSLIWLKFYNSWKSILSTLEIDYTKSYVETENNTKNNDVTNNNDVTETDTNKVYAYNSETASNNELNENTRNSETTQNETITETKSKSGYNYSNSLFDMLEKYKAYQIENTFCDIVKNDIIGFLCYSIY